MFQRTKFKIVIYALLAMIIFSLFFWLIFFNWAQGRDYRRLGDMKFIQSEMAFYFSRFNTYQLAGCEIGLPIASCGAGPGMAALGQLADPVNKDNYRYTVNALSDTDFAVSFSLEAGIAGLAPGTYLMTKEGIRK